MSALRERNPDIISLVNRSFWILLQKVKGEIVSSWAYVALCSVVVFIAYRTARTDTVVWALFGSFATFLGTQINTIITEARKQAHDEERLLLSLWRDLHGYYLTSQKTEEDAIERTGSTHKQIKDRLFETAVLLRASRHQSIRSRILSLRTMTIDQIERLIGDVYGLVSGAELSVEDERFWLGIGQ